ncbi:hypothetical protein [Paenibacillus sp. FSL H3-0333]|uniref:hypothetical protein n=1 Tax=Paenibacillus sp. FSL H3-0333 TaxID=2921373 RepID=UPI0030F8CFCD
MSDFKGLEQLIKQSFDQQDKRLERIEDMLTSLIKIVGATNSKVDQISTDITSVKEGQVRQDRILESLAMRSLEQESELRELKRFK